jgi:hypothetical protein
VVGVLLWGEGGGAGLQEEFIDDIISVVEII